MRVAHGHLRYKKSDAKQVIVQRPESAWLTTSCCPKKISGRSETGVLAVVHLGKALLASAFTRVHHFLFRYGGYGKAKYGFDGKLLADRWRQLLDAGYCCNACADGKGQEIQL